MSSSLPAVLVTGASSGIGATYADRFARRGHDLVLVARNEARMETLAERLRRDTGVNIDVLPADLTVSEEIGRVEARLRRDGRIGILVNNAGAAAPGGLDTADIDVWDRLLQLNVVAVTRLAGAALPRFLARGDAAIINLSSMLGLAPEVSASIYTATKAYVLSLSQSLQVAFGQRGLYVQAVLPAATRTEIWARSGRDVDALVGVMDVNAMVDAALLGFDRREPITAPSLPDGRWEAYEAARRVLISDFAHSEPAQRYRPAAAA